MQRSPEDKRDMLAPKLVTKIIFLSLLVVFLACILTVESHANERGSLNSRCPTCVDSHIHFAVDAQPALMLGLHPSVGYVRLAGQVLGFGSSIIPFNNYRAPPG